MPKLIIGYGYLGRRVARMWQEAGDEVIAVTRRPERAREIQAAGITPFVADVTDRQGWSDLPSVETALYCVGWDRTAGPTKRFVFVDGLASVMRQVQTQAARWIYISSSSVYGQSEGEWVDEETECRPTTPNGEICLDAERMFRESCPQGTILRLAGIYGPGRMLARREQLLQGVPFGGDPQAWLNLIHVIDAASAVTAIEQADCRGKLYLACDDEPVRRGEFYNELSRLLNAPRPTFDPQRDAGRTVGLNKRCRARKLKQETGWAPGYPTFRAGLLTAIESDD